MHFPDDLTIGDIVLTLGNHRGSAAIANLTAEEGQTRRFSHCMIVAAGHPLPLVIEATPPAVRLTPLEQAIRPTLDARLVHSLNLTTEERSIIVLAAMQFLGRAYGFQAFPSFALDVMLKTDKFGSSLYLGKHFPVCSVLVGYSYEKVNKFFGEPAAGLTPNEVALFAERRADLFSLHDLLPLPEVV